MSVGKPPQPFAFLPQWLITSRPDNNTLVYGSDGYCTNSWSEAGCTAFRGGKYNQLASTTRKPAGPDTHPADNSSIELDWVTDSLTLNRNVTLEEFPLGVALADRGAEGYHPRVALGLGVDSTVLKALKASGQIASRSWAMFWGRTGATEGSQLDGNFVFGGYDRAKISGEGYTQRISYSKTECPSGLLVTITDLVLNFSNGTNESLFDDVQSTAMSACIVPDYPVLMTLPNDPYFYKFEALTQASDFSRSFGINYYSMLYDEGTEPYTGDFTIKLSSGLSVRIPNDQLIVPEPTIDVETGKPAANVSATNLVINAIQEVNADDLPQLGKQFLSSAYLLVNQDASEFTVWAANPTRDQDLVGVDTRNTVVEEFCAKNAPLGSSGSSPSDSPESNGAPTSSKSLSGGAIAGIVIGAVAGIAILAAGLFLYISKRKKAGSATSSTQLSPKREPADAPYARYHAQELDGVVVVRPQPQMQELA
ncbi:hypothetical protein FQN53_005054 [Emmonsiellopsis sp. PD_33]|nr:hypothetical protein FQN53_005054 [Emmonsiellopsis sp. PD_33]